MQLRTILVVPIAVGSLFLACGESKTGDAPRSPPQDAGESSDSGYSNLDAAGGSDAHDGDSVSTDAYCAAVAARYAKCHDGATDPDERCRMQAACWSVIFRPEAVSPLMTCLGSRECTKNDDACVAEVGRSLPESAGEKEYLAACTTRLAECAGSFSDDWCTDGDIPWRLLRDPMYAKLKECFPMACTAIKDCLKNTLTDPACQ